MRLIDAHRTAIGKFTLKHRDRANRLDPNRSLFKRLARINVRIRVCAQYALDVWWYRDQFAKLLNTALRLNHLVKAIRFCEC